MWMPPLLDMARQDGWAVIPLQKSACHPQEWTSGFGTVDCHAWDRWAVREIQRLRPDVAVVTGNYSNATARQQDTVARVLGSLIGAVKRVSRSAEVIGDVPGRDKQPVDCLLARGATMRSCTFTPSDLQVSLGGQVAAIVQGMHVGFVDPLGWICDVNECPLVVGNTITYSDRGHISKTYALELDKPFRAAMRAAIRAGRVPHR
jgi:hypothetical protein